MLNQLPVLESIKSKLGARLSAAKMLDLVVKSLEGGNAKAARALLNVVLPQVIPFNGPHGISVTELTPDRCECTMPFRRSNKNHLGGMHAAALATIGEYTAGMLLLRRMDPSLQRLVLRKLEVEYFKQGRSKVRSVAEWPASYHESVDEFRASHEAKEFELQTRLLSAADGVELAVVKTLWQIKPWSQVRKK